MNSIPCRERNFPLHLEPVFKQIYGEYLHWLRHMLERIGRKSALAVWKEAFRNYSDEWIVEILASKWEYDAKASGEGVDQIIASPVRKLARS